MLKKDAEKQIPEYEIKEILSYGDKVNNQSEGKALNQKDIQANSKKESFGELAIEVNKLEDIEDSTRAVKKPK